MTCTSLGTTHREPLMPTPSSASSDVVATIAQVDPGLALFRSVIVPLLGLVVAIVVGWFAVAAVRRWMRPSDSDSGGFTLEQLRRMHRSGEMSDEEFTRAREAIIGRVRPSRSDAPASAGRGRNPSAAAPDPGPPPDRPIRPAVLDGDLDGGSESD